MKKLITLLLLTILSLSPLESKADGLYLYVGIGDKFKETELPWDQTGGHNVISWYGISYDFTLTDKTKGRVGCQHNSQLPIGYPFNSRKEYTVEFCFIEIKQKVW